MEQFDRVEPVLMVRDVSRALAFYGRLGFEEVFRDDDQAPMFDGGTRCGVSCDAVARL